MIWLNLLLNLILYFSYQVNYMLDCLEVKPQENYLFFSPDFLEDQSKIGKHKKL